MRKPTTAFFALALLAGMSALNQGCSCNPVCQFRGTISQPENLSMRRALVRKGMGDFCSHMKTRSAPLKLAPDSPVIGRFFPTACAASEGDALNVSFSGFGYAFTSVTKKVTFTAGSSASYRYDFQVTDGNTCDVYAYFRPVRIDGTSFVTHRIQNPFASVFNGLSSLGNDFGRSTFASQLERGFTVIACDGSQSNIDFALGLVPLGNRPFHPFQAERGDGKITYESERSELHQNQRDFVGPIVVDGKNKALYVTASLDGAPAIDVMVLRQAEGEQSLSLYYEYPEVGPLAGMPLTAEVLVATNPMKRAIVVPPGTYYVLFDHSDKAGQVSPAYQPLDDRAAVVSYLIQIGDAS